MAKAASVLLGEALLTSFVAMACRGEPTGDPKTPANSPIPEVDRKDPDTAKSPTLMVDAGK